MRINAYLTFNGQCEAAFRYYEKCLGGKIVFMLKYGDSPMAGDTPAGRRDHILHATFQLGDQVLGGVDSPPETYRKPQGFFVTLNLSDVAVAERIFATLSENGDVQMALQETFWAKRFGVLVDRFGTPWMIDCAS
jgi:PhnB protein